MADVRPFRGVRYNQALVKDLASVICPPYDIIHTEQQLELYKKSQYNFVRLEATQESPQDTPSDNKYTRAAATLKEWLEQGILRRDEVPAIYFHDHSFTYQLKEYRRRGIIACIRLEDWDKMIVRPHENTMSAPKSDRLNLMWALQANISPVLGMYEDPGNRISTLLTAQESASPLFDIKNVNGEGHKLWAVTDLNVVKQISKALTNQPIYIADGHHRYESALTYRRERLACSPSASPDEAFNFVMMTLLDFTDPGLLILPTHRLVRGLSKSTLAGLRKKLEVFFDVEEVQICMPVIGRQFDDLLGADEDRLILFGLVADKILVLKPHDPAGLGQMMPQFHSQLYKRLAVSVVDHIILEKVLVLNDEKQNVSVGYSHDSLETVNAVLNRDYQLAILLSPVKAGAIKAIADARDRMPRKSTYFYPKAPAGLVVNLLS